MKNVCKTTCVIVSIGFMLFGCNPYKGYEKTESGLYYTFYTQNPSGIMPKNDDVVSITMEIRTEDDSVIFPVKTMSTLMQPSKFQADVFEAIAMMHEGDSASFIINAKKYFNAYNYGNQPDFINDETMLWFTISILHIESKAEYESKNMQRIIEEEKQLIATYVNENNITVQPTASGLYYIEKKKGKGASPVNGKTCMVHYKGMLLDGTVFDTSEGREPFSFPMGQNYVIKGWEEGISLMKKGGKALFIIPSSIGYGDKGAGDMIPPFSPLLFEVELLDVK